MLTIVKLIAVAYFTFTLISMYKDKVECDMADEGEWGEWFRKASKGYSVLALSVMAVAPVAIFTLLGVLLVTRLEAAVGFVGAMPKLVKSVYELNEKAYRLEKVQKAIAAGEMEAPKPLTKGEWLHLATWLYYSVGLNIIVKEANKRGYDLKAI